VPLLESVPPLARVRESLTALCSVAEAPSVKSLMVTPRLRVTVSVSPLLMVTL
jgi:hypothetical protein